MKVEMGFIIENGVMYVDLVSVIELLTRTDTTEVVLDSLARGVDEWTVPRDA